MLANRMHNKTCTTKTVSFHSVIAAYVFPSYGTCQRDCRVHYAGVQWRNAFEAFKKMALAGLHARCGHPHCAHQRP